MKGTGDDLLIQFLAETDFRSVVAVESDALENVPETISELHISLFGHGVAMMPAANAAGNTARRWRQYRRGADACGSR